MKMKSRTIPLTFTIIVISLFSLCASPPAFPAEDNKIIVDLSFSEPLVTQAGLYHRVEMEGLRSQANAGEPVLPIKGINILISPGKGVKDSRLICGERVAVPGRYFIQPGQKEYPLSYKGTAAPTSPNPNIYGQNTIFPREKKIGLSPQGVRGYIVKPFEIRPVEYNPITGELFYYRKMKLIVELEDTSSVSTKTNSQRGSIRFKAKLRGLQKDRERILRLIDNKKDVIKYEDLEHLRDAERQVLTLGKDEASQAAAIIDPSESYKYVIITSEMLMNTPGPYNLQALCSEKESRGISCNIVTTEWIYSNYDGTRPDGIEDNQTKIRNFIIDTYNNWETEYILLCGDGDEGGPPYQGERGPSIIPARGLYESGYGYVDIIPGDLYYACLDGTFDSNANGIYGEPNDGVAGEEVDLLSEVYVGRAPVDSCEELSNFVRKTLQYIGSNSPYLAASYMVGEFLWGDPVTYAKDYLEEIRLGSNAHGYTTTGFASCNDLTASTLYEADRQWTGIELANDIINTNVHIINHLGHCATYMMSKIYVPEFGLQIPEWADVASLGNSEPFFMNSQGCYPAAFDNRNTSGSYDNFDCIAEKLLVGEHGAFAIIGNSRYGWGMAGSTDGSSQYYQRQFWDAVFGEGRLNLGIANQDSKEDNIIFLNYSMNRWCYFEINLLGDPELSLRVNAGIVPATEIKVVNCGLRDVTGDCDGNIEPGETVELTVSLLSRYGESRNVIATLRDPGSRVIIDNGESDFGTIERDGIISNTSTPFRFTVNGDCLSGERISLLLSVTSDDSSQEESVNFEVYNPSFETEIDFPKANMLFRLGDVISVTGRLPDNTLDYRVEWRRVSEDGEWTSLGVSLTGRIEGELAQWDTNSLSENEQVMLKLTVRVESGEIKDTIIGGLRFDARLHAGWPKRLHISNVMYYSDIFPMVADLDGNGTKEIIAYQKDTPARITAWDSDGGVVFDRMLDNFIPDRTTYYHMVPAIADLDNDRKKEIFVYKPTDASGVVGVYVILNHQGIPIKELPLTAEFCQHSPVIVDLDGNGQKEIILMGYHTFGSMHTQDQYYTQHWMLLNSDGEVIKEVVNRPRENPYGREWINMQSTSWNAPIVGNFDNDSDLEFIIITSYCDRYDHGHDEIPEHFLHVFSLYDSDGTLIENGVWPKQYLVTDVKQCSRPVSGDLDGDNKDEFIIAFDRPDSFEFDIFAYDCNGNTLPGWPISRIFVDSAPILGDFDGDGDLEVVIKSLVLDTGNTSVEIFHHRDLDGDGTVDIYKEFTLEGNIFSEMNLADVNGDNTIDIVVAGLTSVSFYDTNGNALYELNLPYGSPSLPGLSPSISDLDGDGRLELVYYDIGLATYYPASIYIWDLDNSPLTAASLVWPDYRHDLQRTGRYGHNDSHPELNPIPGGDSQAITLPNTLRFTISAYDADPQDVISYYIYQAGDLDHDGVCTRQWDLPIFAAAFGSSREDINFNAEADLDNSGRIDFGDFSYFAPYIGRRLPSGIILNSQTGEFSWTPGGQDITKHMLTFVAIDSGGLKDARTITVKVTEEIRRIQPIIRKELEYITTSPKSKK